MSYVDYILYLLYLHPKVVYTTEEIDAYIPEIEVYISTYFSLLTHYQ